MKASFPIRWSLWTVSAVVAVCLLVACTTEEGTLTTPGVSYRATVRTVTTRRNASKEASDEFDKAIAAARSSTTTGGVDGSSTSTFRSSSSTSSSVLAGVPSSTNADHRPTPDECKLFAQLINFVGSIEPLVDTNDPEGTALRVADPVAKSKAGLDQLIAVAPAAVNPDVQAVIAWLRSLASGGPSDQPAAQAAVERVRLWYAKNCASA